MALAKPVQTLKGSPQWYACGAVAPEQRILLTISVSRIAKNTVVFAEDIALLIVGGVQKQLIAVDDLALGRESYIGDRVLDRIEGTDEFSTGGFYLCEVQLRLTRLRVFEKIIGHQHAETERCEESLFL